MKVDGAQAADAGGGQVSPPAFQIVVLVSASGTGLYKLYLQRSTHAPWAQVLLLMNLETRCGRPSLTDVSGGLCSHPAASSVYIAYCST